MYTIFCATDSVLIGQLSKFTHTLFIQSTKMHKNYLSLVDFVYNCTWITVPDQCPFTTETMRVKQYAQIENIFWKIELPTMFSSIAYTFFAFSSHYPSGIYLFIGFVYKVRVEKERILYLSSCYDFQWCIVDCCFFHSMEAISFQPPWEHIMERAFSIVNKLFVWMNAERNSYY